MFVFDTVLCNDIAQTGSLPRNRRLIISGLLENIEQISQSLSSVKLKSIPSGLFSLKISKFRRILTEYFHSFMSHSDSRQRESEWSAAGRARWSIREKQKHHGRGTQYTTLL